ncbi:MAG: hypothetical protein JWQ55_5367, partial [Rhodopila sp.]|nr:hypothetical protein [Rhodopila sp.]
YAAAADMLAWLMIEARRRKLTGVALKDDRRITVEKSFPERLHVPHRLE